MVRNDTNPGRVCVVRDHSRILGCSFDTIHAAISGDLPAGPRPVAAVPPVQDPNRRDLGGHGGLKPDRLQ